jgi:hypothetical protein
MVNDAVLAFLMAGGLYGLRYSLRRFRAAQEAARLNRAETQRVITAYPTTPDGRNADRMPKGRYAEGSER